MKHKPGDILWSDYFKSEIVVAQVNSDSDWYFKLKGRSFKAQTSLSMFEKVKSNDTVEVNRKWLEKLIEHSQFQGADFMRGYISTAKDFLNGAKENEGND